MASPVTAVWLAVAGEVVAVTVLARTGDPGVIGIVGCAVTTAALLVGFGLLQLRADLRSAGPDRPGLRRDVLRR